MRCHAARNLLPGLILIVAACSGDANREAGTTLSAGAVDPYDGKLGTVDFPVSCSEAASRQMERGLALLHNMMYADAEQAFKGAGEVDAECAMAYWGQAITFIHPLWNEPLTDEELARGRTLVEQAMVRGQRTEREEAFIAALAAYYEADAPSGEESPRLAAYSGGWQSVYDRFPEDPEAALLYALAYMATALPADKSYTKQMKAGAIAESVLERIPDHPGGHHYVIHAYDYPPLAERALEVARNYGRIAPEVPHSLHMPTHIFTRLGLWQESIDWNKRSAVAAWNTSDRDIGMLHHLHALDYLAYAYLQQSRDVEALAVLESMLAIEDDILGYTGSGYPLSAIPARYALERQQWTDAAGLEPRQPASFPWDEFPQFEAITHFARAMGAARSGHPAAAREALDELAALRDGLPGMGPRGYWRGQIAIQHTAALAWTLYAEGDRVAAIETARAAAEMEAATEKHPVTPGEILPASELLGDMLLEIGRPAEALAAYQAALERSPGRFNSLYGAGRAAEMSSDRVTANEYYDRLIEIAADADTERPRLLAAQSFLDSNIVE